MKLQDTINQINFLHEQAQSKARDALGDVKTIENLLLQIKDACLMAASLVELSTTYGVKSKHGLPRSNEDKKKIVLDALANPMLKDASNYEIAKICMVSQSFVAGVRDPDRKKKQKEVDERSVKKRAAKIQEKQTENKGVTNQISNEKQQQGKTSI